MSFFDGKSKPKQNINLSGSSRTKTLEQLLREAEQDRQKRELEKKKLKSAIKIQAWYRSCLARKRLREKHRAGLDELIKDNNPETLRTLLAYFVQIYNDKDDKERLIKLSQRVFQIKETIVNWLLDLSLNNFLFTFSKFLKLNIRILNKDKVNVTIPLRLIEYFTDEKSFIRTDNELGPEKVQFIFNYIIRYNFIDEITMYAINKIPVNSVNKSPVIVEITKTVCELIMRAFHHLKRDSYEYNKNIVNAIYEHLFSKINTTQIRYHVIPKLSEMMTSLTNTNYELSKCFFDFLDTFHMMIATDESPLNNYTFSSDRTVFLNDYRRNLFTIYAILKLYQPLLSNFSGSEFKLYLSLLARLVERTPIIDSDQVRFLFSSSSSTDVDMNDDDDAMEEDDEDTQALTFVNDANQMLVNNEDLIRKELFACLNSKEIGERLNVLFQNRHQLNEESLHELCRHISSLCFFVLMKANVKIYASAFLSSIAFNKMYLAELWKAINNMKTNEVNDINILRLIASGCVEITNSNFLKIVSPLYTFCSLYNFFLLTIMDEQFLKGEALFSKEKLIEICAILKEICVGIISLMHSETRSQQLYIFNSIDNSAATKNLFDVKLKTIYFTNLFQSCSKLVQRLYTRDVRKGFCPEDHWISKSIRVTAHSVESVFKQDPGILSRVNFGNLAYLFQRDTMEINLSVHEVRCLTILQEMPFTVDFKERVKIFETCNTVEQITFLDRERVIDTKIRRTALYEDAFNDLSVENAPNLKNAKIRVTMVNQFDMAEAGIDGGGVYREFINDLLTAGFNPETGFFSLTSNGFLYPNPNVASIHPEFFNHFFFLGRMLAKAIQTKYQTELKFADFFLQKILLSSDTRLDINYLESLDPEVYKHLLLLLKDGTNAEDLGLCFAINEDNFGQTRTIELIPRGENIPVTNKNKIEYITLYVDYKLNKQIQEQMSAFRAGLSNIIDLEFLRFFNFHELQNLISGDHDVIDVDDWRHHTVYQGEFNEYHPAIKTFWKVLADLNEEQKKKLLKFATSRPRPPLFGFKNLIPNFAIHSSVSEDRIPSSSTCLNLLKLPPITDYDKMKEKLLCAIESEAGFDLS